MSTSVQEYLALGNTQARWPCNCLSVDALERSYLDLEGGGKPASELLYLYERIDEMSAHYCDAARHNMTLTPTCGPMPAEKMARLELGQRRLPPYLIRIFSPHSGGGLSTLNGPRAARTHHDVLHDRVDQSIFDMDELDLTFNVRDHLANRPFCSEFSSWAASLFDSMRLGMSCDRGATIAVLDMTKLKKHRAGRMPDIFHVQELWRAGISDYVYDVEYLVHGTVGGPGYHYITMPYDRDALARFFQSGWNPCLVEEATEQAMQIAQPLLDGLAPTSNPGIFIYMVAMLLGLQCRNDLEKLEAYDEGFEPYPFFQYRRGLYKQAEEVVFAAFEPCIEVVTKKILLRAEDRVGKPKMRELRKQWADDETIMFDLVFTGGLPEVKMAIRVLRHMAMAV